MGVPWGSAFVVSRADGLAIGGDALLEWAEVRRRPGPVVGPWPGSCCGPVVAHRDALLWASSQYPVVGACQYPVVGAPSCRVMVASAAHLKALWWGPW